MTSFNIGRYKTRAGREAVVSMVASNCLLGKVGGRRLTWTHAGRRCADDIEDDYDLVAAVPTTAELLATAVQLLRDCVDDPDAIPQYEINAFLNALPPAT